MITSMYLSKCIDVHTMYSVKEVREVVRNSRFKHTKIVEGINPDKLESEWTDEEIKKV